MSSKKLLAASMAAVLATGTIAAVATADAPADAAVNDDYTLVIDGTGAGAEQIDSAKLSIKTSATSNSFSADYAAITAANGDMSKLGFSSIKAGLWEAFEDFKITETSSASLGVTVKGKAQEYAQDQFVRKVTDGDTNEVSYTPLALTNAYLPKIKDGKKLVVEIGTTSGEVKKDNEIKITAILDADGKTTYATADKVIYKATQDDEDAKISVADYIAKAFAQAEKVYTDLIGGAAGADYTLVGTDATKKIEKTAPIDVEAVAEAQDLGSNWRDSDAFPSGWTQPSNPSGSQGKNLGPVTLTPEFTGLSDTLKLVEVGDALFTLEAELTVDGATYKKYVEKNYAVNGAAGNWNSTAWDNSSSSFNAASPSKIGLGIVANSTVNTGSGNDGHYDSTKTTEAKYCGWTAKAPDANLEAEPELSKSNANLYLKGLRDIDDPYSAADPGHLDLTYYNIVNPNVLKNLNNGGTVTFTLDKPLTGATLYGAVKYLGADQWHTIDADDNYVVNGNEITFNFPAGLTYHADLKDKWHPFYMEWDLSVRMNTFGAAGSGLWDGPAPSYTKYDGNIVKMTFRANKDAGVDDPSVGGDGENSGNGGNTSNPGSTSGNPNTGIALAVAPIVLAAGAVVTIASKKRK